MLVPSVRYLKAVADHGSFTRAAAALHVSQPALSQQIRDLEERMAVQLIDRSRSPSAALGEEAASAGGPADRFANSPKSPLISMCAYRPGCQSN